MRMLLLPLSVLTMIGLLFGSVSPARACVCAFYGDWHQRDHVAELLTRFYMIVIGTAELPPPGALHPEHIYIDPLKVLKGPLLAEIPSSQFLRLDSDPVYEGQGGMCDYGLDERSDRVHLLLLYSNPDGTYTPSGCGSVFMSPDLEFLLGSDPFPARPPPLPPAYGPPGCESDLFDIVAEADVIVGGRFTGWQPAREVRIGPYVGVRVAMTVDKIFKGTVNTEITVSDFGSLQPRGDAYAWAGDEFCGAFDSDPSGTYAIIGLWRTGGDTFDMLGLNVNGPYVFRGPDPAGAEYELALTRLSRVGLSALTPYAPPPATADDSGGDFPYLPAAIAATLGPLAFLAAAAFVWRRRA